MLMVDGVLGHHSVRVVVVLIDHAVTVGVLVGIHDVGHVKGVVVSQPVIDDQQLLSLGNSAGRFDQSQNFVTGSLDGSAVVSDTQLVAVVEVQDHTGQIVHGHVTGADSINRNTGQRQHLTQDAQAVFALVVVIQEEGNLQTQSVCVCCPLVQVLLIQAQNRLDLLLGQRNSLLRSVVPDLDCLQLGFKGNDCRVFVVDLGIGIGQNDLIRQVNLKLIIVGIDSNVFQGRLHINEAFLLCFFMLVGADLGNVGGDHQTENHGQRQRHAEEALQIFRHSSTSFLEQ